MRVSYAMFTGRRAALSACGAQPELPSHGMSIQVTHKHANSLGVQLLAPHQPSS